MYEQILESKLALLDLVNQLESAFLMWREHKEEPFMGRVDELLEKAIVQAQALNELFPENPDGYYNASIFQTFAEAVDSCQVMDARFMTVGFGWAAQSKVSPTAFNTINRTIINLSEKSREPEDNFLFLRQAIQREAANI